MLSGFVRLMVEKLYSGSSVVEYPSSMLKALVSIPSTAKKKKKNLSFHPQRFDIFVRRIAKCFFFFFLKHPTGE
jgi:hypothetical protein